MANEIVSFKAGGNIAPSRFVILDTTTEGVVTQAGAGGIVIGVSQEGSRRAPWTPLDDGFCAIAGEDVKVYTEGAECYLEYGGTVTQGARLKADSDGKGVTTVTDHDEWGAVAVHAGVSGTLGKVMVKPYRHISL